MIPVDFSGRKPPKKDWARKHADKLLERMQATYGNNFYASREWLEVRFRTLAAFRACCLCGSKEKPLHVDHIKPRSKHPELELDETNLQVLCWRCNIGKGNSSEQDFRESP